VTVVGSFLMMEVLGGGRVSAKTGVLRDRCWIAQYIIALLHSSGPLRILVCVII